MSPAVNPLPDVTRSPDVPLTEDEPTRVHLSYQPATSITPSRPEWLWKGWIVRGALNLMTGRQGSGKTTLASHAIAALTLGMPLPGDEMRPKMRAAILSLEEPADRLVARLMAAGADLDRVVILGDVEDRDDEGKVYRRRWQLPLDVSILGDVIRAQRLALVVVDGLGYTVRGDSHNYAVVGSALSALAGEAERTKAAILGLVHPPKGGADPVTAAIGSTAWTSVPRVSIVVGVDPDDPSGERRVARVGKSNFRQPAQGIRFEIGDDPTFEVGFVKGLGASDVAAEDIVAAPLTADEKGERGAARDALKTLLADGPRDAAEVIKASGFSERTLRRARQDLGVVAEARRGERGRVLGWSWSLPHGQTATSRPLRASWPSGPSGNDQVFNTPPLPDGQRRESGHLDAIPEDEEPF